MSSSRLDSFYRRLLITKFFEKGWGKPENLQRLFEFRKIISNREKCFKLVPPDYPIEFTKEEKQGDCTILEGNFKTPLEFHLPGLVPCASQQAYFQMLIPNKWITQKYKPMCIHLAGTGDHYFWRRRNFIVKPLLKEANIGGIILENPFYGVRKPGDQVRSNLHNVSDIFVMGGCLILECLVLLHWCERMGYGPLGVTGLSMGGHMASLAATNWPKPLVLVPCLSWSTAATVFTTGVMSQSINWDMLETQYFSDGQYCERLSKMVAIIDDAFAAGQKFVKNFNQSMCELKEDIKDVKVIQSEAHLNGNVTKSTNKTEKYPKKTDFKVKHIVKIDNNNTIGLSKNLHSKFMSKSKFELSQSEENELNLKIRNIKKKDPELTPKEETRENIRNQSTLTKLMEYILPRTANHNEKINITKTNWWEREALQFMRGMMDECTHLKNFSVPFDTSLIIAVCAKDDAYVPREGCSSLEEIWPGVEVRYLDAGHVSAYVLHQKLFRSSIMEAFDRAKHKLERFGYRTSSDQDLKSTITYEDLRKQYKKTIP